MKTLFLKLVAAAMLVSQGAQAQNFDLDLYPRSPAQEHEGYYGDHDDDWDRGRGRGRGDGGVIRRDVNRVVGNGSVLDVGRILGLDGREMQQASVVILRLADQGRRGRNHILAELFVNGRLADSQYTDGRGDGRVRLQVNNGGRRGVRTLQVRLSGSNAIFVDMVGARLHGGNGGGGGFPGGRMVQITCESFKPLSMECQAGGPILNAYVVNQRSNDDCIQGRSWYINYQNNSIVVSRGCRATFNVEIGYRY
jgi:hypothetical protein